LSLTIGVAFATVLVVGGILAMPAVIDCSHQGGSVGACLRDKLEHSGMKPLDAASSSSAAPVLSSEAAPPAVPEPAVTAPIPVVTPHDEGWIDARANEYEPIPLQAEVSGAVGAQPQLAASAELAPLPVEAPPEVTGSIGAKLEVDASASLVAEAAEPAAAPSVQISTDIGEASPSVSPPTAAAKLLSVTPPDVTGNIGSNAPISGGATLLAQTALPVAPPRPPAAVQRPKADVKPRPVVAPKGPTRHLPARKPPRAVFKNDPRFPSITVLPPPSAGQNSSFATLQTR
jgi:hypothetical protein